jgi:hypothetical protein
VNVNATWTAQEGESVLKVSLWRVEPQFTVSFRLSWPARPQDPESPSGRFEGRLPLAEVRQGAQVVWSLRAIGTQGRAGHSRTQIEAHDAATARDDRWDAPGSALFRIAVLPVEGERGSAGELFIDGRSAGVFYGPPAGPSCKLVLGMAKPADGGAWRPWPGLRFDNFAFEGCEPGAELLELDPAWGRAPAGPPEDVVGSAVANIRRELDRLEQWAKAPRG